jgi:RimJ/RimL family protein N-acetyltransferase
MTDRLRTHGVVLVDGSLMLRPFTEDDWSIVAPWNTDPRVLWFSEGGFVEERSVAEVQGIYRGVSQAADVFVIENDGVAVGDGWVQSMNLPRITTAFPEQRTSRIDLQLSHDVWGRGLGTRAIRLMTAHAFDRGDDLVFGVDISDFNDRSRRAFLRCGYVPWRRVPSPPGAKTRFVHDLICRPEVFRGTATSLGWEPELPPTDDAVGA